MFSPVTISILGWLCFIVICILKSRIIQRKFILNNQDIKFLKSGMLLFVTSFFITNNTYNADYKMYEYIYSTYKSQLTNGRAPLFEVLCYLGNALGFDYQTFYCAVLLFSLFLIFGFIVKYSKESTLILLLYIISSAVMDGIQIRQFIATAIYMYTLPSIILDDTRKGTIKYIAGVLIASGFHTSFVFWLILLLIKVERRKRIKYAVYISIAGILGFYILQKTGMLFNVLSYVVPDEKIQLYLVDDQYRSSSSMVLKYIISQPMLLVGILFTFKKARKYELIDQPYINTVIGMNVLVLILCPVLFYSLQFRRMLRVIFIPSYISIEKLAPRKSGQLFWIARVVLLLFALIALYWNLYSNTNLLGNLFNNNYYY